MMKSGCRLDLISDNLKLNLFKWAFRCYNTHERKSVPRPAGGSWHRMIRGRIEMKCPFCAYAESKVIDSRPAEEGATIRRRRECLSCKKRFTTYETMERLPLVVIKRDGSRQSFDRMKVLSGMVRACEKRQVPLSVLERISDEIEQELQNEMEREVSSADVGELVMQRLKDIDEVAYVRFASVYRQFKDIGTFMDELSKLLLDEGADSEHS